MRGGSWGGGRRTRAREWGARYTCDRKAGRERKGELVEWVEGAPCSSAGHPTDLYDPDAVVSAPGNLLEIPAHSSQV